MTFSSSSYNLVTIMPDAIKGVFAESLGLYFQMSPYLLFGFLFAGILHVFISIDWIARHLGKRSFYSVVKAVILGIPLPLCSCGVIPAAMMLRKKGATRGAVIGFLIATPITGVDSIFATFSLLGGVFTIFRIVAASLTALVAGVLANLILPKSEGAVRDVELVDGHRHACCEDEPSDGGFHVCRGRLSELFHYAFVELLGDVWRWLVIGILLGGAISHFVPASLVENYLGSGWLSMLLMLAIGIPMYVCATGSIPVAAALMLKGLSPGAALVFLLAGPATNAVTITVVAKELGKGAATIYILVIAVMSILMGMLLNALWASLSSVAPSMLRDMQMLPRWIEASSAVVLAAFIVYAAWHEFGEKECCGKD